MGHSLECVWPDPHPQPLRQPCKGSVLIPLPEEEAEAQRPSVTCLRARS